LATWGRTLDKPAEPEAWLLSAYRAGSHAAWADWLLASQGQWRWQRLERPGRFFAWRIRGNPLSWLDQLPASVPDLIVATSMVDLATLKGLFPRLARAPVIYFQGLAVSEAASAGAWPLVPDALCYPEQYPVAYRYQPGDSAALAQRLREWLSGELRHRSMYLRGTSRLWKAPGVVV
jgi:hypothetical protein